MEMCKEMYKLRELLTEKRIEWHDESTIYPEEYIDNLCKGSGLERSFLDTSMYRTHFTINNTNWSAINGYGSYGGFDPIKNINHGLLELFNRDGSVEPIGWLTAEDVIKVCEESHD